ncbi:MAG: hypothetical protein D3923_02385, partial [Candidatus Electrothrix sp. AR3]|nr:hypothetical protein [Candidatus Electrothrix sp. AR3]
MNGYHAAKKDKTKGKASSEDRFSANRANLSISNHLEWLNKLPSPITSSIQWILPGAVGADPCVRPKLSYPI